jgi:hypothetical protein
VTPATIQVHRAGRQFLTRADGIESRHCFSFGEHYDPDNVGHGALLVSNDERVRAGAGFPDHPHRDAEIVTWVLSGSLVHEDSTGHRGVVQPGLAQRLSAGRGVVHSERNDTYALDPTHPAEPVHFVQSWVRPDRAGVPPAYEQAEIDLAELGTGWLPIASGHHPYAAVSLGTAGATLWVTVLAPGATRTLPSAGLAHLYLARGAVGLASGSPRPNDELASGDSVRVTGEAGLVVTGRQEAELLLWTFAP